MDKKWQEIEIKRSNIWRCATSSDKQIREKICHQCQGGPADSYRENSVVEYVFKKVEEASRMLTETSQPTPPPRPPPFCPSSLFFFLHFPLWTPPVWVPAERKERRRERRRKRRTEEEEEDGRGGGGGANASWEISEQLRIWEEMRSFTQQTRCSKVPLQRRSKWKWPHSATRVYTGYKYSLWEIVLESNVKKGRTLNRMCSRSAVPCWQIQPSR